MKFLIKILKNMLMMATGMITPTCEVISQKVSESLDHDIGFYDKVRIKIHHIGCEFCRRYEEQIEAVQKIVHGLAEKYEVELEEADIHLSDEAKTRIKSSFSG